MDSKAGNLALMSRIKSLLGEIETGNYSKPLSVLEGASIGQHVRHIIDFYQCLLRDIPNGVVDYGLRDRNPLMETEPTAAKFQLEQLAAALLWLDESSPLHVRGDFSPADLPKDKPLLLSSLGRELMYAHDHAVHHLALIRIGMKEAAPWVRMDPTMGYAPTTISHKKTES